MKCKQIVLASRPHGLPSSENFRFEDRETVNLNDNEVLLQTWYISVDPYMRGRMNDVKSYAAFFQLGEPISGGVVAKVIESRSNSFVIGDTVFGMLPWATYCVEKAEKLRKVDITSVPPEYYLGILGMPGITAYFGMTEIGKPKATETVVVSGAAGAVGIVAGQIAKIMGSNVVGIAGSDEKCKLLKEQFGFDEAINYKTAKSMTNAIATACPKGVDVYFDNVGGDITDSVIANLNFHSRIVLCGQISLYNSTQVPTGPRVFPQLLIKSTLVQGFIVSNYSDRFGEAFADLTQWINEGKLKYTHTTIHGFNKLPDAFIALFSGENLGKMLVETGL